MHVCVCVGFRASVRRSREHTAASKFKERKLRAAVQHSVNLFEESVYRGLSIPLFLSPESRV